MTGFLREAEEILFKRQVTLMERLTRHSGYHGTTLALLGEEQLREGRFFRMDHEIFLGDFKTAARFAYRRASQTRSEGIILKISSTTKPILNPHLETRDFAMFCKCFPKDADVRIDEVRKVDPQVEYPRALPGSAEFEAWVRAGLATARA